VTKIDKKQAFATDESATLDDKSLIVRPAQERDLETIWKFYEDNFGALPIHRLKKRWRWQFVDNPACREQKSSIWVAEIGGKVAGQLGAFPVRMKIMDREMIIQFECDFAVDPGARKLNPVWPMQFLREVLRRNGTPLKGGTDWTPPHAKLREKWLEHRRVYNVPTSHRPYRRDHVLRQLAATGNVAKRVVEGPVGDFASTLLAFAVRIYNRLYHTPAGDQNLRVVRIREAGPEFDALWMRLRDKFPITTVRDNKFVRWRFYEDPVFENVIFGAYDADFLLQGYIAVRTARTDEGIFVGRIVDLFCDPDEELTAKTLLGAGLKWLEQFPVEQVTCRGVLPRLRCWVREFLYRPKQFEQSDWHPLALYLWVGAPDLAEAVYDAENWHYTYTEGSGGFSP